MRLECWGARVEGAEAAAEGGVCRTEAPSLFPRALSLDPARLSQAGAEGPKSASPASSVYLDPHERSQATRPSTPCADPSEPGLTG